VLKYLFSAYFRDGTVLHQTEEDKSINNPDRNAYSDVLERLDEVIAFTLSAGGHVWGVNLQDGWFNVDGVRFRMHEDLPAPRDFRLVYFLRQRHFPPVADEETGENLAAPDVTIYRFGWTAVIPSHPVVEGRESMQAISRVMELV